MLTAANRTTKQAQEVTATRKGELLVMSSEAKVAALADTGAIAGPVHLVGMVIESGTESAQMTLSTDGSTILVWKTSGAGAVSGIMLPWPIPCPNGITATKNYGNAGVFLVYYIED